jgi:hypothetical protein
VVNGAADIGMPVLTYAGNMFGVIVIVDVITCFSVVATTSLLLLLLIWTEHM